MDLQEVGWGHRLDWSDSCKRGNEPSGSIKCEKFPDNLRTG
jgi:hypothetical protein